MTIPTDDNLLTGLLTEVPEMWPSWDYLTGALGEGFDTALVLEELADFVTPMLLSPSGHEELLERAFHAVDVVAMDGDEGATAVAYGFLDTLRPEVLPTAIAWLGPCTSAILDALEDGSFDPDSELSGD